MAVIGLFSHMFRMCFRILHGIDYLLMVCAKVMTSCVSKKIYILCKFRHREKMKFYYHHGRRPEVAKLNTAI